ncbi:hypothetical protein [Chengkuizengella sediminis]|uniref:hypothetical protein n=1 Tax=Chengkuizengella sediminis TaxID=1885917 RepID=UPI001389D7BF|nr:hypothetical protein [Chengkuizengella sediminis]NDI35179.1 hypothetical protein [Chengkuizengella sediminis]
MKYNLNIGFDEKDLENIYNANQKVLLIKESPGHGPVAWVTFDPFQKNQVNWIESYDVYASTHQSQEGATIDKMSERDAVGGCVYDFGNGIFKHNPGEKTSKGSYKVMNTTTENLTFGLAQSVKVNGNESFGAPINATTVLAGQDATFIPHEKVKIFLQSNVENGQVLSTVSSKIYTADFGGVEDAISVKYDGVTGQFIEV